MLTFSHTSPLNIKNCSSDVGKGGTFYIKEGLSVSISNSEFSGFKGYQEGSFLYSESSLIGLFLSNNIFD